MINTLIKLSTIVCQVMLRMILLTYAHKKKFKKISSKTITSILNKTTKNQYLQKSPKMQFWITKDRTKLKNTP